ncbi:PTS sugar transporter subunit IIB [Olsenella massiliensis]|uniref:PTS sugar transporter subunit IIB n=1 Tax=Olsenella massiliensis TaxID=1622075 RepID=UPI00071E3BFA|nr:PTS sugar transporter subunit IIB [Olsenella massiliensis]
MKKIVLLCSAGMSTSLLVTRIREAARSQAYDAQVDAYPLSQAEKAAAHADVVLIGPQVRFQLDDLKKRLSCPVDVIDMMAYGTMDGAKTLAQAQKVMGE